MAKRYDEPIEVTTESGDAGAVPTEDEAPVAFRWRGRTYEVDLRLRAWREAGEWWDNERAAERDYFRVLARPAGAYSNGDLDADGFMVPVGAVYDVYRDRLRGRWHLARVWD